MRQEKHEKKERKRKLLRNNSFVPFNKIKFLPLEKSALELAEKEKVNHEGERNQ